MNFLQSLNLRTTILLLIPGSLWGFAYILNEIIIETIPPFTRGVTRSFVMIVPLLIMLYARGGKLKSTWAGWRPYIFVGLFDNAIPGVLITWGQLYIDGGLTTILGEAPCPPYSPSSWPTIFHTMINSTARK